MGRDSRFRILLNRRKYANWEGSTKVKIITISCIIILVILLTVTLVNVINFDSTKIVPIADSSINEQIRENIENNVNIYNEPASNESFDNLVDIYKGNDENNKEQIKIEDNVKDEEDENLNDKVYEENNIKKDNITFTALGQIMMGASITDNLDYHYSKAFKSVTQYTRYSDFTYGVLSTNITNLDKISNVKSKYIVTKSIKTAFTSLGVDALNIATGHITDYDKVIFTSTIDVLKNNNIYMAGINDSTLYVDVGGKKIAIIAALSSYIGNKTEYDEFGINLYNEEKMLKDISQAKDRSDIVIVDIGWGRDDSFGVTATMRDIAKKAIDAGAGLIIGSNALGIYPMYTYNGVPIIYSTGCLITDSDYYLDQNSYIWQFNINKENRVDKLVMIPTCIVDKTYVKNFKISSPELCDSYNEMINSWNTENGINSTINEDGSITILF